MVKLNSDFIKKAFSSEEQKQINNTTIRYEDKPRNRNYKTKDKIFCLSEYEVGKYLYDYKDLLCKATIYAKQQGALTEEDWNYYIGKGCKGNCRWWLRSPGMEQNDATVIAGDGDIDPDYSVHNYKFCVRPALFIKI